MTQAFHKQTLNFANALANHQHLFDTSAISDDVEGSAADQLRLPLTAPSLDYEISNYLRLVYYPKSSQIQLILNVGPTTTWNTH